MHDEAVRRDPSRTVAPRSGRFRRHALELPDGGRLILHADGTIDHVADDGTTERSWAPGDPEWPDQAIRFGLRPQAPTITPQGRRVGPTKPPRG